MISLRVYATEQEPVTEPVETETELQESSAPETETETESETETATETETETEEESVLQEEDDSASALESEEQEPSAEESSANVVEYAVYDDTQLLEKLDSIQYSLAAIALLLGIFLRYLMVHNIMRGNK